MILMVACAENEIEGFKYFGKNAYSAGGVTNIVKEYRHEYTGMIFVLIPAKKFFLIGKYEVTQDVWYRKSHKEQ